MELLKYISMRWWLAVTLTTGSCVTKPPSASNSINAYTEDVTRFRTTLVDSVQVGLDTLRNTQVQVDEATYSWEQLAAEYDDTQGVNALQDSIAAYNAQFPSVEGFTVLVYSGTDRERATYVQREVRELGYSPKFEYQRPNFKVKVGRFTDRLEATRLHLLMKENFRTAIVVPERIRLR